MARVTHTVLSANSDEARERWSGLSVRCSDPGIFDDFDFVTGLARVQDIDCSVLFSQASGLDVCGIVLPFRTVGPFREAILPRFCPTSPVLMTVDADTETMTSVLEHSLVHFHRVGLHLSDDRARRIGHPAWSRLPLHTYVFDLSALRNDNIASGWSSSTRRLFRRNREAYEILETPAAGAATAVDLCAESYRRAGRPLPVDVGAMARFAAAPPGHGRTRTFVAVNRDSGEEEAGVVVLSDADTAFYWIAGSRPGAAMTVLIGSILDRLRDSGIRWFDFLGANTPSIAEFKRRFGPTLTPYTRLEASRSRLFNLLLAARSRFG